MFKKLLFIHQRDRAFLFRQARIPFITQLHLPFILHWHSLGSTALWLWVELP